MATDTTPKKLLKQEARKVLTVDDLEAHTELAYTLDAIDNQAQISAEDGIIGGFEVEHDSGNDFSVGTGFALDGGELVKLTSAATVTLNDNASGTWRKDLVVIDSTSDTNTDTSFDKRLSTTTVTQVTASTIGTGNGVDTLFDLGQSKVIPRTLLIENPSSTTVAGWVFVPEGGAGTNDAILFETAPASGNINATFKYYTGAEEEVPGVAYATRKQREASITVVEGTPGSPVSAGAGQIPLAEIEVPNGWTGGAPTDIQNNSIKTFLLARDQVNDTVSGDSTATDHSPFDRAPRITDMIRNMAQVRHGCRLRYSSSTQVKVGPGFLVSHGLACRNTEDVSLTLQSTSSGAAGYTPSTGWYAVYAVPQAPNANGSGVPFTLDVGTPPNSLGQDTQSPVANAGTLYLGSVYCTVSGATVTLREFYSDGDGWVWWASPSYLTMTHNTDKDFSDWVPPTARMVDFQAKVTFTPTSPGDTCTFQTRSHKVATAKAEPILAEDRRAYTGVSGGSEILQPRGVIKLEEDLGGMYCHPHVSMTGGSSTSTITGRVMGFKDDYLINDASGAMLFY